MSTWRKPSPFLVFLHKGNLSLQTLVSITLSASILAISEDEATKALRQEPILIGLVDEPDPTSI